MLDQADQLRRIVRDTLREQHGFGSGVPLVAVAGGRREVGTTTIAIGLSRELARLGKKVVLADGNLMKPEIASRLKLSTSGTLADVLTGTRSAVEILHPIFDGGGSDRLSVLPGLRSPNDSPDMSNQAVERLFAELRSMHSQADYVVLDIGSRLSPWAERFWQTAEQVLLVTTTDPTATQDSYATLKLACGEDVHGNCCITDKVHLVINSCGDTQQGQQIAEGFSQTSSYFLGIPMHSTHVVCSFNDDEAACKRSLRLLAADVIGSSTLVGKHRFLSPSNAPLASASYAA